MSHPKKKKKKKKSRPLGSCIRPHLRSASGEDLAKKIAASEVKPFDVAEWRKENQPPRISPSSPRLPRHWRPPCSITHCSLRHGRRSLHRRDGLLERRQLIMLMILKCIKCHSAFLFSHFDEDRDKDTTVFFRSKMMKMMMMTMMKMLSVMMMMTVMVMIIQPFSCLICDKE